MDLHHCEELDVSRLLALSEETTGIFKLPNEILAKIVEPIALQARLKRPSRYEKIPAFERSKIPLHEVLELRLVCKCFSALILDLLALVQKTGLISSYHTLSFSLSESSIDTLHRVSQHEVIRHLVKEIEMSLQPLDLVRLSKSDYSRLTGEFLCAAAAVCQAPTAFFGKLTDFRPSRLQKCSLSKHTQEEQCESCATMTYDHYLENYKKQSDILSSYIHRDRLVTALQNFPGLETIYLDQYFPQHSIDCGYPDYGHYIPSSEVADVENFEIEIGHCHDYLHMVSSSHRALHYDGFYSLLHACAIAANRSSSPSVSLSSITAIRLEVIDARLLTGRRSLTSTQERLMLLQGLKSLELAITMFPTDNHEQTFLGLSAVLLASPNLEKLSLHHSRGCVSGLMTIKHWIVPVLVKLHLKNLREFTLKDFQTKQAPLEAFLLRHSTSLINIELWDIYFSIPHPLGKDKEIKAWKQLLVRVQKACMKIKKGIVSNCNVLWRFQDSEFVYRFGDPPGVDLVSGHAQISQQSDWTPDYDSADVDSELDEVEEASDEVEVDSDEVYGDAN